MVLMVFGALVMALGVFCGAVLALAPLGLAPATADMALWALFPLLSITGFVLLAMAGRSGQVRNFTFAAGCVLLALALAAVAGIVLSAMGLFTPVASTAPLWYVLAVAGLLGIAATAAGHSVQQR
ncbi:hypothetical protein [Comamonas sp. NLF-1-9]|uniref:hypothetical protein n=1 Tax=Comamonas sp. NLF-1-9 TaxID=2853163 RepID=UPI001C46E48B|nr:hypothetical protein [Comamonas sp. NLF-1-9]QXL84820.1 hypothetical protein KUD94_02155 [Comamonas sp. NLF-1-9]